MIQKTFSATTKKVSAAQVWKLMANINDWSKWDNTVEFAELNDEFRSGATFRLRPKGGPVVKIRLLDVQTGTYFKDCTSFPLARMYGEHWFEETSGGLKITVTMTMTGILAPLWHRVVMKDIVEHLPEDVQTQIESARHL